MSPRIPFSEFEITYARSSGPGGQNVNKVNSKAVLRWNVETSPSLSPGLRDLLRSKLHSRLTHAGELVIMSDRFRDQGKNREDCIRKFHELIEAASRIPKARKKSKPTRSSVRKSKEAKKKHSEKKKLRSFKLLP